MHGKAFFSIFFLSLLLLCCEGSATTPLNHTITFVNYCDNDIYIVHQLGPQGYFPAPDNATVCSACSCSPSHNPCPTTNCSKTKCCDGSTPPNCKNCSQGIDLPDQGGFKLNATNGTKIYTGIGPWWESAVWGRTGCTPVNRSDPNSPINCAAAATHDMVDGNDSVSPGGAGATNPATKFEWTFDGGLVNPTAPDFYDVSLVDGYNAAVKMYPINSTVDRSKNPFDKNHTKFYGNASGTGVELNSLFSKGVGKLSRKKLGIQKDGQIFGIYSACSYYSNKDTSNATLTKMACCIDPWGSNKSAPVHCDPDKCLPDETNPTDFFKQWYPHEYSYAYDDDSSTFQAKGFPTNNTEYIVQFCQPNITLDYNTLESELISQAWSPQAISGSFFWEHPLGGSDLDYGESAKVTTDGGSIIAGYTRSGNGDVDDKIDGIDQSDFWVVKLDASGSIVWEKCLGGSDDDMAYDIIQTNLPAVSSFTIQKSF